MAMSHHWTVLVFMTPVNVFGHADNILTFEWICRVSLNEANNYVSVQALYKCDIRSEQSTRPTVAAQISSF